MNIGVDIDNTLTDIDRDLFEAAYKYTKKNMQILLNRNL